MAVVRAVTVEDWELMRDVRLAALAEAPYAFGSTHAREVTFTEAQWRDRISDRSVTFFAYDKPGDVAPAGLGGVLARPATRAGRRTRRGRPAGGPGGRA